MVRPPKLRSSKQSPAGACRTSRTCKRGRRRLRLRTGCVRGDWGPECVTTGHSSGGGRSQANDRNPVQRRSWGCRRQRCASAVVHHHPAGQDARDKQTSSTTPPHLVVRKVFRSFAAGPLSLALSLASHPTNHPPLNQHVKTSELTALDLHMHLVSPTLAGKQGQLPLPPLMRSVPS